MRWDNVIDSTPKSAIITTLPRATRLDLTPAVQEHDRSVTVDGHASIEGAILRLEIDVLIKNARLHGLAYF